MLIPPDYKKNYINLENHPPVANADSEQLVQKGSEVTLDGSQSSDPDYNIDTYYWEQNAGEGVIISDRNAAITTFTAPANTGDNLIFNY